MKCEFEMRLHHFILFFDRLINMYFNCNLFQASAARAAVQSLTKKIVPLFDRVLVEKAEAIGKTKGGLYIPEKAQGKVVHGTIVAAGPGAKNEVRLSLG